MEMNDINTALAHLLVDESEEHLRLNVVVGKDWWVFVKDSFNFTFTDCHGVERRWRYRISRPAELQWCHPDDVIILGNEAVPTPEHGRVILDGEDPGFPEDGMDPIEGLEDRISIIQRDGDRLFVSTFLQGSFVIRPDRVEDYVIERLET
jgi:hypothetical protein